MACWKGVSVKYITRTEVGSYCRYMVLLVGIGGAECC